MTPAADDGRWAQQRGGDPPREDDDDDNGSVSSSEGSYDDDDDDDSTDVRDNHAHSEDPHDGENDEHEADYEEDDDDDDDRESPLDYLLDKSSLAQHGIAVLVALVATLVGFAHLNGHDPTDLSSVISHIRSSFSAGSSSSAASVSSAPSSRGYAVPASVAAGMGHYHVRGDAYRRTSGLRFCPLDDIDATTPVEERVRRILHGKDGASDEEEEYVDPNLRLFEFHVPAELVENALGAHYLADEMRDDNYGGALSALGAAGDGDKNALDAVTDAEFRCASDAASKLLRKSGSGGRKKYIVKGHAVAYVQPDFAAFFPLTAFPDGGPPPQPASLSHTGFALKFVNLNPKPVHFYWDGGSGHNIGPKLVGLVQPYESVGTATTPGMSFHVTPTYDKSTVLKRWTVTADEALIHYDPYQLNKAMTSKERENTLAKFDRETTAEQKYKYRMQLLNLAYARDYLIKTGRTWLGNFPRPVPRHFMWNADCFGQTHSITTSATHFTKSPPEKLVKELTYDDYESGKAEALRNKLAGYRNGASMELKLEAISVAPRVFKIDNFLSPSEADHILELGINGKDRGVEMGRSTVHPGGMGDAGSGVNSATRDADNANLIDGAQIDVTTRSSTNGWVDRESSPVIDSIYRRAADLLRIDESLLRHRSSGEHAELATHHSIAERLQLVKYEEGQEYAAHHDFLHPGLTNRYQPGRFATLLLYLSDDGGDDDGEKLEGGETSFPRAVNHQYHDGISVKPQKGTAVLFYNVLPDGNYDDWSLHAGRPVVRGTKWLANLWVWEPIID